MNVRSYIPPSENSARLLPLRHELAEQFRGEMPLKKICYQEGGNWHTYIVWRSRNGLTAAANVISGVSSRWIRWRRRVCLLIAIKEKRQILLEISFIVRFNYIQNEF